MFNTLEKDMFLFILAYQNHIYGFDVLEQRETCVLITPEYGQKVYLLAFPLDSDIPVRIHRIHGTI